MHDAAVDEAIDWVVRLEFSVATPSMQQAFARWHDADPAHRLAWERVKAMDASLAPPISSSSLTAQALRRTVAARRDRRRLLSWCAAFGATGAIGWQVATHAPWQNLLADAATGIGEQRRLTLEDGSRIVLNTDTAVSYRFNADRRDLTLHRGEILVHTGADERAPHYRPFGVATKYGALRALGTRFNVRLGSDNLVVRVEEGAVELRSAAGNAVTVAHPGQAWRMGHDTIEPLADRAGLHTAWVDGLIDARDMRLGDLLAELGRYRAGRIDCDPAISNMAISGLYHTRDTTATLQFLAQHHGLRIKTYTRWWVRVSSSDT